MVMRAKMLSAMVLTGHNGGGKRHWCVDFFLSILMSVWGSG